MDAHGIAYAWLLTWYIGSAEEIPDYHQCLNPALHSANDTHPGIPLAELIAARDKFPQRFLIGYCPNPMWRNAAKLLEAAHRMHGACICGEWKYRMLFDDPRSLEIFHAAGQLKMPVVLHLDVPYLKNATGQYEYQPVWFGGTVDNLERALLACPKTNFIGHAPGFWREISGNAADDPGLYPDGPVTPGGRLYRLFETYPNLYADLSADSGCTALQRDPDHALRFVSRFPDRLLFGRDYYGQKLHEFLQTLPLPADVVENIYHRNAERLVPPPTSHPQ
jgi:predicted TIM-barrel fold metal-dependent hydrolase